MRIRRTRHIAAIATLAIVAGGCGKKGPPLPPFVRIPAAIETIEAARFGNEIYVTLTVPAVNVDMSVPVDIERIEVYGYTGASAPPLARWVELGTLVATIPVSPPPITPPDGTPPPAPLDRTAALPGNSVSILDALTADELVQGPVAAVVPLRPDVAISPVADPSAPLRRFYIAVPFSQRSRPGPPSRQVDLVLAAAPDPPADLRATYDPTGVSLVWEPSGGLLGFLLDRALPREVVPFDEGESARPTAASGSEASVPEGPTTYQVYRDTVRGQTAQPDQPLPPSWRATLPVPMNPDPLQATTIRDAVDFGLERCYTVRAQRGGVLSEPSSRVCVTPRDVFPPGPPVGLTTIPSEGAINLIWEPNTESDLGGYLVLRRGPGDATLRQLTSAPIGDARYRDMTVESGARYSYSVVAVDTQAPQPNASAPSATVDEVAR
jgi:hypothetical protein